MGSSHKEMFFITANYVTYKKEATYIRMWCDTKEQNRERERGAIQTGYTRVKDVILKVLQARLC